MSDRNLRIRMILEASDKVTRPLRDMAGGSSKLAQSLKATRDRLKDLDAAQADVNGFRSLRAGLRDTTQELGSARARIVAARAAIASVDTPTRKMTTELTRAEGAAKKLEVTQRAQAASLRAIRTNFREAGVSARDLTAHEQRLGTEISETTAKLQAQERRLSEVHARQKRMSSIRSGFTDIQDRASGVAAGGASAIAAGVAVGAPLIGAARGAMSLEEGMAGVAKVTGMAAGPLGAMQDRIVSLSTKIPMAAVELANIAAAAGAAGVGMDKFGRPLPSQAADLVAFTDAAARMGIAFDMSAEDAGGTMAKWRQAFKMTQPEVEALGDRINALTNKYGGKASDVSDIVTRIGPLGKVAGIAAPQVSALASSLSSIGVENEIAGTGIKNTLLTLTKGTAATKDQAKSFKALGLDAEKVAKSMQVDASGTIIDVFERIAKLKPEKQASLLSELFGSESVGAIAPLLTNLDGLKQRLQLVGNKSSYAGSMTGEFLSRINTTTGATDLAKNGFDAVNISLGQALLPTIKSGAQRFAAMAARMRVFAQQNPGIAKGVTFLAGGIAILFGILGAGGIVIAAVMGPIAILNAGLIAMGVAGGLASIGLLPIIGTIAAIALGAATLAMVAYQVYANWGKIGAWFSAQWQSAKNATNNALAWFASLPAKFRTYGSNIVSGLIQGFKQNYPLLYAAVSGLSKLVSGGFTKHHEIKSPSRLFKRYGGFITEGLALGIHAGSDSPVRRLDTLSTRMAGAIATGMAAPALALSPSASVAGSPTANSATGFAALPPIKITINGAPGQNEQQLAELVGVAVQRALAGANPGRAISYADPTDYGDA